MSPSEPSQTLITRRRLATLTAAGGSALVLAACGTEADPNKDKSDAELLGYIRELQSAITDGYESLSKSRGPRTAGRSPGGDGLAYAEQSKGLLAEIDKAFDDLGEKPPQATFTAALDVSSVPDYEPFLVGVVNAVVPDLDDEALVLLAYKVASASAGRTAANEQGQGKQPGPGAFVLGDLPPGFEGIDQ